MFRPLAVVVAVGVVSVSVVRNISLGGSVQALGDGVQSSAGAKRHTSVGIGITVTKVGSISLGLSISRPLSVGDGGLKIILIFIFNFDTSKKN